MKTFISYRHTGASKVVLGPLLQTVHEALADSGVESYCTFFEQQEFDLQGLSQAEILQSALRTLDDCDFLLVVQTSEQKSEGMLIEVGYSLARGIPVVVATKEGVEHTYLPDIADTAFVWNSLEDLAEKIQQIDLAFNAL